MQKCMTLGVPLASPVWVHVSWESPISPDHILLVWVSQGLFSCWSAHACHPWASSGLTSSAQPHSQQLLPWPPTVICALLSWGSGQIIKEWSSSCVSGSPTWNCQLLEGNGPFLGSLPPLSDIQIETLSKVFEWITEKTKILLKTSFRNRRK